MAVSHPSPRILMVQGNSGHLKLLLECVFVCDFKPSAVILKWNTSEIKGFCLGPCCGIPLSVWTLALKPLAWCNKWSSKKTRVLGISLACSQLPQMTSCKRAQIMRCTKINKDYQLLAELHWLKFTWKAVALFRPEIYHYSMSHYRLACHIYNAKTSLGTHAKCMVIGTPSRDYRTHCGAVKVT